jgi:uncharacterized membrane protein
VKHLLLVWAKLVGVLATIAGLFALLALQHSSSPISSSTARNRTVPGQISAPAFFFLGMLLLIALPVSLYGGLMLGTRLMFGPFSKSDRLEA